jgi:hypothetical protein
VEAIATGDGCIFGGVQSNLESGAVDNVHMSKQERALYWDQQEIHRMIDALPLRLRFLRL